MKLKTKFQDEDFDLGEVVEGVIVECLGKHEEGLRVIATAAKGGQHTFYYSSIKKFMDDWEDAPEEPKGIVKVEQSFIPTCVYIECSTEEEAEKVAKRLRAWERLKDKGFRFKGITPMEYFIRFTYNKPQQILDNQQHPGVAQQFNNDLDLLFSGEDD